MGYFSVGADAVRPPTVTGAAVTAGQRQAAIPDVEALKRLVSQWDAMTPSQVQSAGLPLHVRVTGAGQKEIWLIHPSMREFRRHSFSTNPPPWAGEENAKWRAVLGRITKSPTGIDYPAQVRYGMLPYETFKNDIDGQTWGKFYDERSDVWTLKPYTPPGHVLEKIGKAIVAGVKWVFKSLKKLFDWICRKQGTPEGQLAMAAAAVATGGTGAVVAGTVSVLCSLAKSGSSAEGPYTPVQAENPWLLPLLIGGGGLALLLILKRRG